MTSNSLTSNLTDAKIAKYLPEEKNKLVKKRKR